MAKKIKNPKLLHPKNQNSTAPAKQQIKSAFSNLSQKIQKSKQRKMQKLHDTKNRLMKSKKDNKIIKVNNKFNKNNKVNKFALLDDADEGYQPINKLTHKGTSLDQVKYFNDMHFDNDDADGYSDIDDQMHAQANFHGFQEDNDEKGEQNDNRRKSKNEIYKQIIQKSKMHKRDRQQQYQQNFNSAVQLDEQYNNFVRNLKFRSNDSKVRDKIQNTDVQYERLMNQLKQEERVVAVKVVDNNKKGVDKLRKKKNIQLNQLMKNSDDQEEEDIRGWVKGLGSDDEQENSNSNSEADQESDADEIDDVELSSGDEDEEGEQEGQEGQEEEQQQQEQEDEEDEQEQEQQEEDEQGEQVCEQIVNKKGIIIKSGSSDEQEQDEQDSPQAAKKKQRIPNKGGKQTIQPAKTSKHKPIKKPSTPAPKHPHKKR